jgi:hypothetical protein
MFSVFLPFYIQTQTIWILIIWLHLQYCTWMPEKYKVWTCLLNNVFYCPISWLVISVSFKSLAHIREIKKYFYTFGWEIQEDQPCGKEQTGSEKNKVWSLNCFHLPHSPVIFSTTIVFITHLLTLTCALKYTKRLISPLNNFVVTWNILTILSSLLDTDIAFQRHVL